MTIRAALVATLAGLAAAAGAVSAGAARSPAALDRATVARATIAVRAAAATAQHAMLSRPLRLPRLRRGAPCPVSRAHTIAGFIAPALGPGPVYPVFGGAVLTVSAPARAGSGGLFAGSAWGGGKTVWIATARYRGPVLVRGRELGGARGVRFGTARMPAASLRLAAPGAFSVGQPPGWRQWPSETRVEADGCYGLQIDGTTFSTVVVLRAAGLASRSG